MKRNKIEVCKCGHNRCEHTPMCCVMEYGEICKCKKYQKDIKVKDDVLSTKDKIAIQRFQEILRFKRRLTKFWTSYIDAIIIESLGFLSSDKKLREINKQQAKIWLKDNTKGLKKSKFNKNSLILSYNDILEMLDEMGEK